MSQPKYEARKVVDWMSSDWTKKTLKDLATISYGKSPKDIFADDGQIPIFGTGGIERFGKDSLYEGESIILGRKGTIDNPVYVNGRFWAIDTTYFLKDFKDADVKWLYYFLRTVNLRSMNEATGVPSLAREYLYSIEIDTPPKEEQTCIAAVLSCIDRAIEQTKAVVAKQKRMMIGLVQDLLTKGIDQHGNIRSEATHEFKDSPLGRIPAEWKAQKVGVFLEQARGFVQTGPFGSQLHAHEYVPDGVPVIMPQDISDDEVSISQIARIPESKAEKLSRHRVQLNDIVFARRGDLSRVAAIGNAEVDWLCGTGCLLMRVGLGKLNASWFATAYRFHSAQRQVEALAVGSTMPNLNTSVISNLLFAFPPLVEQDTIMRSLLAHEAQIKRTADYRDKLVSLKQGLMQDLLRGAIKVENVFATSGAISCEE